jgi:hypothetical protein
MNQEAKIMGEETIQYDHNVTFEKVWASLMELRESNKERAEEAAEEAKERAKEAAKAAEERAKEHALMRKEADREMRELRLSMEETERQMQESAKRLDKQLGRLGNKIGELIEQLLVPDTLAKFKAMGYKFTKICSNVRIEDKHDRALAEIDFMLENGEYALIGEVKLQPNDYDVTEHIERMKKIRVYSDERGDTRKLIGAIAGAIFHDNVKKYAQTAGFYVITASGEDVDIEPSPTGWEPKTEWA